LHVLKGKNHKYQTILLKNKSKQQCRQVTGVIQVVENSITLQEVQIEICQVSKIHTVSTEAGTAKTVKGM